MNKTNIIPFIIIIIIMVGVALIMTYNMANQTCIHSEIKPYRTVPVGLFGIPTKMETTLENSDGNASFCKEYYSADLFSPNVNLIKTLEYFSNRSEVQK